MAVGSNGFWSSDRANNRAGVEDLSAFNAAVAEILNGIRSTDYPNPNYASPEDIDAGGFVDPGTTYDVNPTITRYNRSDIAQAAQEIARISEDMGVNLFTTDGGKPYFYNTGNSDLNTALYGNAWIGENAFSQQKGTFESPVDSMSFGDYATQILPSIALGALAGPFVSTVFGAIPGIGSAINASNFVGAGLKSALSNAVVQGVTEGSIDVSDMLRAGLTGSAGYIATDFMKDLMAYTSEDAAGALLKPYLEKQGLTQEDLANLSDSQRTVLATDFSNAVGIDITMADKFIEYGQGMTKFADFGGLLGPDGFLSQVTGQNFADLNIEGMQNAVDNVLNLIPDSVLDGIQNLLGPGPEWDTLSEQDKVAALLGQYDERFFDLMTPRGESQLQGIWNREDVQAGLSSAGDIASGGLLANILGFAATEAGGLTNLPASVNSMDWGVVFDAIDNIEGPNFDFTLPDVEFSDINDDTTVDPDNPLGDTINDDLVVTSPYDPTWPDEPNDPVVPNDPMVASPFDPTWEQSYQGEFEQNRINNEGFTPEEIEFAQQQYDELVASGDDPSNYFGGDNGYNRDNWVLYGWRNREELQDDMFSSELPPELGPPSGSDELPPSGSDELPSGGDGSSALPSAGGLLGTPRTGGSPMAMPGVPSAQFQIAPAMPIRASNFLDGLLSRYVR